MGNSAPELSHAAQSAIGSGDEVFVSAVSIFEAAQKHRAGKWPEAALLLFDIHGYIERQGFRALPLTIAHAEWAATLPMFHRDPFGRMLIAQAMIDDLALVSDEEHFDRYLVRRLW